MTILVAIVPADIGKGGSFFMNECLGRARTVCALPKGGGK